MADHLSGLDTDLRLFKLLVVGDSGTGKTALIRSMVHGPDAVSRASNRPSGAIDFATKVVNLGDHTRIYVQLWDVAGQSCAPAMTRAYMRGAAGAFIVSSVDQPSSWDNLKLWKAAINANVTLPNGMGIPLLLVSNKVDLRAPLSASEAEEQEMFWQENGYIGCANTSATSGEQVQTSLQQLLEKVVDCAAEGPYAGGDSPGDWAQGGDRERVVLLPRKDKPPPKLGKDQTSEWQAACCM